MDLGPLLTPERVNITSRAPKPDGGCRQDNLDRGKLRAQAYANPERIPSTGTRVERAKVSAVSVEMA